MVHNLIYRLSIVLGDNNELDSYYGIGSQIYHTMRCSKNTDICMPPPKPSSDLILVKSLLGLVVSDPFSV